MKIRRVFLKNLLKVLLFIFLFVLLIFIFHDRFPLRLSSLRGFDSCGFGFQGEPNIQECKIRQMSEMRTQELVNMVFWFVFLFVLWKFLPRIINKNRKF